MIIEKSVMKTEAKFSENKEYRYLLSKEWNNKKSKAMVVMINPSSADEVTMDFTTLYTINNLTKLGYGSVDIVNLYPKITTKLKVEEVVQEEIKANDELIIELAEKVDAVILAWGKKGENNKKVANKQEDLIKKLSKHKEKLFMLGDGKGGSWYHPLAPQVRFHWELMQLKK